MDDLEQVPYNQAEYDAILAANTPKAKTAAAPLDRDEFERRLNAFEDAVRDEVTTGTALQDPALTLNVVAARKAIWEMLTEQPAPPTTTDAPKPRRHVGKYDHEAAAEAILRNAAEHDSYFAAMAYALLAQAKEARRLREAFEGTLSPEGGRIDVRTFAFD